MKKPIAALVVFTGLTACTTFSNMETGLGALVGQDAHIAFNVLGYPSGKQEFGQETVYYWSISRSGTLIMPQTSTATGWAGTTPVSVTSTQNQFVPVNYTCQIKLVANDSGVLTSWEYEGNIGGCQSYSRRLKSIPVVSPAQPAKQACRPPLKCDD